MCKISVIVPVYNTEKYLSKCVESILMQTFKDFELILVDDGTPDHAGRMCDKYAQEYDNVKVIHQSNAGLALARKAGVDYAQGEYIIFVDSDDWVDTKMLEIMYECARKNGADFVSAQFQRIDEKGKIVSSENSFAEIVCGSLKEALYEMHVTRYLSSTACAKLIKKDLFTKLEFPNNLAIGEEHDMVVKLILKSSKVVIVDTVVYSYLMRGTGISKGGYNPKYSNSLTNYIRIERQIESLVPEYKGCFRAFYAEFEMAVVTAMCRNKKYDWNVIRVLQKELRKNIKDICKNQYTGMYLKISAVMIAYIPHVFIGLFRLLHLVTGR